MAVMKILSIVIALLIVPAVGAWGTGCADNETTADNGGGTATPGGGNGGDGGDSGNGGDGGDGGGGSAGAAGSAGTGGTGGTACVLTGRGSCNPDLQGFACCDYPDAYCDPQNRCQAF